VFNVVVRSHGFAALQLVWIGLLLAACTWWNGYRFTWYLADFAIAYVQLVSLVQAMCVAALAIALPAPMAIAHKLLLFISDHRASGQ
jgi:hypothetical protein